MTRACLVILLISACGSKSPPPAAPVANTTYTATAGSHWDVLAQKGASWTLHGADFDPPTFTVKVVDVVSTAAGREVQLDWGEAGGGPSHLTIAPNGVLMYEDKVVVENPPSTVEEDTQADGRYVNIDTSGGEVVICFGFGPGPDAGMCADVCFSEMCVAEKAGIVRVEGTWAPNYAFYAAPGFER